MIDLRSLMGYSKGSPWESAPYNLIKTSDGRITMANTKKKLKAFDAKTGKFLSDLEPGKEYKFLTHTFAIRHAARPAHVTVLVLD